MIVAGEAHERHIIELKTDPNYTDEYIKKQVVFSLSLS